MRILLGGSPRRIDRPATKVLLVVAFAFALASCSAPKAQITQRAVSDVGHRPGEILKDCAECPQLVVVPSGSFVMGSPTSEQGRFDDEGPQHRVAVQSFAMGIYEVTFEEWDACVA